MVTLNLNSAVWAKDDSKINSKESFKISENTNNRDINTQSNNTQANNNENINTGSNCDSPQCQKTLDNAMGMLNNLMKPTLP
jgi:hypothetical protein